MYSLQVCVVVGDRFTFVLISLFEVFTVSGVPDVRVSEICKIWKLEIKICYFYFIFLDYRVILNLGIVLFLSLSFRFNFYDIEYSVFTYL